jgi:hypothetical protein
MWGIMTSDGPDFSADVRRADRPTQQFAGVVTISMFSTLRRELVREVIVKGQLVPAGPGTPEKAICPACGGAVRKRKRCAMGGQVTYFYRHERGTGEECPLRYHPCTR